MREVRSILAKARRPPEQAVSVSNRRRLGIILALVLGVICFVLLWFLYDKLSWANMPNSDSSNGLLMAHGILGGNWDLHGWTISSDDFYTTEVPVWVAAAAIRGLQPALLHQVPAFLFALLVAAGIAVGVTGSRRPVVAAVLGAALLIPLDRVQQPWVLLGMYHVPTIFLSLASIVLAYGAIDRGWHRAFWWASLALVCLAIFGDPMALILGTGPIYVAILLRRPHQPADRPRLLGIATASALGMALRTVWPYLGGFAVMHLNLWLMRGGHLAHNLSLFGGAILRIFGVDFVDRNGLALLWSVLRLTLLLCVVWALLDWLRCALSARRPPDFLDDTLAAATIFLSAAFVVSTLPTHPWPIHYLTPVAFTGTLLAVRRVRAVLTKRLHVAVGLSLAMLVGVAALPGWSFIPARPPQAVAAAWLRQHGLTNGFADYWSAASTSTQSGGAVAVWPVAAVGSPSQLVPYDWIAPVAAYRPRAGVPSPRFLILDDTRWLGVTHAAAVRTWGLPASDVHLAGLEILIWKRPIWPVQG